jgi:hypothetical protein
LHPPEISGTFDPYPFPVMHRIFSPADLTEGAIQCSKCNWKGSGEEAEQEFLFLTDALELYCPDCDNYFGFINQDEES